MAFRSTGSYEPDQVKMFRPALAIRFDPQALTSLTLKNSHYAVQTVGFDPQALTSLTPDTNRDCAGG